ncbi:MAG: hypothetical protein H7248_10640 [Microbacteriaceae bacterium]|nr:hypothetical protein [Microbacteriaceae bacterium]
MRVRRTKWAAIVAFFACLVPALVVAPSVSALSGTNFDPGYIISDPVFSNSASLSEAQIQAFLESQMPNCVGGGGAPCLRDYTASSITRAASAGGQCGAFAGADSEPASRIIFRVSQACQINPQLLIVLLQKEQGLVTATSPTPGRYRIAMGYGCPDTAPCDAQFYGFANQVYKAAWQFREYLIDPSYWRYKTGNNAIQWHPNASCGSSVVTIRNQATAALYNYTPYQPNAAALANLTGSGDACSSYGNRNFWVYFSSWFGSPVGAINPVGAIESLTSAAGQIRITGWAYDPDTTGPIDIHVYVKSSGTASSANIPRPDVEAVFPGIGPNHGYDISVPVTAPGVTSVCVYAFNAGPGVNVLLGCPTVTASSGPPFGVLDSVTTAAGMISVMGWALDPDTAASIPVHIYVDGVGTPFMGNRSRPDVARAYPGFGDLHGFAETFAATPGPHTVCAFAVNAAGPGNNPAIGCQNVTVATGLPFAYLDSVTAVPGAFITSGWAIDPDTASSIGVHLYLDGVGTPFVANRSRPDVGRAFPGYGDLHGFSERVAVTPGSHTLCAYAINFPAPGANPQFGCRVLTALSGSPIGAVDAIIGADRSVTVRGWTSDPDTVAPIDIRLEIDGAVTATLSAAVRRPDVAVVYPIYGPTHGFSFTTDTGPGQHRACIYGVNVGPGSDTLLGCATVTS